MDPGETKTYRPTSPTVSNLPAAPTPCSATTPSPSSTRAAADSRGRSTTWPSKLWSPPTPPTKTSSTNPPPAPPSPKSLQTDHPTDNPTTGPAAHSGPWGLPTPTTCSPTTPVTCPSVATPHTAVDELIELTRSHY